ncbi:putative H/ACA ribonucleoprotein complex subunit 4 [Tritrichomonas foetus]|uniref:H/ACA ribonucleoprotein complex subunit 4 n=1 Tax=Tritrichomonas foetus TaxID=1144522 RepID=A0A1J4JIG9_9EUKA|nr:putative H/ACA ribonucleoprotein complex subunit 4 [Tritrichomonas foetus]|eukprot:OHS98934.1 putative H/ACA ribonucleoprotein complex subunit 4 [Tritrichomonas foetus]
MSENQTIQPSDEAPSPIDTSKLPLLLKNYSHLMCRDAFFTPLPEGHSPLKRPLRELLKYGVLNLDKPANPSSHEIVSWVKQILKVEKTGHSGTLDPKVTGVLIICIERATRIAKSQQNAGKEYVAVLRLFDVVDQTDLVKAIKFLTGRVYQCPPLISAVKKQLRVREIMSNELIEYDPEQKLAIMRIACEAGTYIRVLCEHLGLVLGVGGEMAELRRTRTGNITEETGMVTMHDLLDAKWLLDTKGDESLMRRVIRPLEWMLTSYKRIVVKDSSVDAICHGAKVLIPGVMRFDSEIEVEDIVVIITTKGEAVALGIAQMTSQIMATVNHGIAAKIKRVIMDRGTYQKCWGTGPVAQEKKRLIKEGKLDEKGKPNAKTPVNWLKNYLEGQLAK